ncbi:MAG: DUF6263 family protein [Chitinophagales bacterium]
MKKHIVTLSLSAMVAVNSFGQKISGKPKFQQGQSIEVNMEVKTTISQEAMGQAIDFNVDGTATHIYKVTNTTDDNSTLHHKMQRITFVFDGMGQKRNFDSNNPKDMDGQFGKPIKDVLDKSYDMVINPNGKVMMAIPEKIETTTSDPRLLIVTNMLKDVLGTVQPPRKGEASFFKVLPENEIGIGESWTYMISDSAGKSITTYKLTAITDSTVVVDFTGSSNTVSKAEMMGMETTTTLNNKTTGKIILDKATGIVRQKNAVTESTGTTESSFGSLPVTSKIITTINVKPGQ